MTQQNLYAINTTKFHDDTLYVQYSYRTKKISIMNIKGTVLECTFITFDFFNKAIKDGAWKLITHKQAKQLLNEVTSKPTEPKITYYKHKDHNSNIVGFYYISYNHNTKQTLCYNKPKFYHKPVDDVSGGYDLKTINSIIQQGYWIEITKDEALKLVEPKTTKQSKSYYTPTNEKGWFVSYDPVTPKTTMYCTHNCKPYDITREWHIKAINEFVKTGKWIEINREQALSLLTI